MTQFNSNISSNTGNTISFKTYLEKVFGISALGVLISTVVAFVTSANIYNIYAALGGGAPIATLVIFLAELGIAIYMSAALRKMSKSTAWACYIAYSVLTGLTLSLLFAVYEVGSIVFAFAAATILFACMAIIGHTTHIDITRFGSMFTIGLVAIIITSLLNLLFFRSSTINYIMAVVGVIIFLGIIAYDVQKLQRYYSEGSYDQEFGQKMMIMGAFELYLDFINLFIRILQIFGNRKSNK